MKGLGPWLQAFPPHTLGNPGTTVMAQTNLANTFTLAQIISRAAGGTLLTLETQDAGDVSGTGAEMELYQNSATPAANNVPARWLGYGKDSGGNKTLYGGVAVVIGDTTNTSEDGYTSLLAVVAGSLAESLKAGDGVVVGGATGGFPGAGKVNSTGYKINNSDLIIPKVLIYQDQRANGTDGGDTVADTWTKRTCDDLVVNTTSIVPASSVFPIPAGKWLFLAFQTFYNNTSGYAGRIRNTTDNTTLGLSLTGDNTGFNINVPAIGYLDVASGTKNVELQYQSAIVVSNGLGLPVSPNAELEVYSTLAILQIG
jgi:hypothetical protein